jgi:phosphoesterase RecJ-like protein
MNIKKLFWQDWQTIQLLVDSLKNDEVSITSTDTILGLLANLSKQSFSLLNQIKEERTDKPYLILISSTEKLAHFVDPENLNQNAKNLIKNCWPGPLTIIFKAKKDLPPHVVSKEGKIALRIPSHKDLRRLLDFFDGLFSTSANKSGKLSPKTIYEVDSDVISKIKYVVLDKKEDLKVDSSYALYQTLPSSIIDLSIMVKNLRKKDKGIGLKFFSAKSLQSVWREIQKAKSITLLTHFKPDGDGISGCAALEHILNKLGKKVETIYPNESLFKFKRKSKNLLINKHKQKPDLLIVVDTANYERMYYPDQFEKIVIINIDHHVSNSIEGKYNFIDPDTSSTCEILFVLFEKWCEKLIDKYVAECILFGILYDTMVFQSQSIYPQTLRICAKLMEYGANFYQLKNELLANKDPKIFALWGKVLSNIKISKSGKAAWACITQDDLKKYKVTPTSLIGFDGFLSQISKVDISLIFYQTEFGKTKVSLRSKKTDVNKFAAKFGGGGHKNAAGIMSDVPMAKLIKEITSKL